MIQIALAGDINLEGVGEDPREPWGDTLPLLEQSDVRICNLGCDVGPKVIRALRTASIDVCTLANEHVLDGGPERLRQRVEALEAAGIHHAGAGMTLQEARRPAIVPTLNGKVAVISFTDNAPEFSSDDHHPGNFYLPVRCEPDVLELLNEAIAEARRVADVVVVSAHWGAASVERPTHRFQAFAERLIDLGADVFHGHGAHTFQGVELHRGKPILYDCGDFLGHSRTKSDGGFLFSSSFEGRTLRALDLTPMRPSDHRVAVAQPPERQRLLARMRALSEEMGVTLVEQNARLAIASSVNA